MQRIQTWNVDEQPALRCQHSEGLLQAVLWFGQVLQYVQHQDPINAVAAERQCPRVTIDFRLRSIPSLAGGRIIEADIRATSWEVRPDSRVAAPNVQHYSRGRRGSPFCSAHLCLERKPLRMERCSHVAKGKLASTGHNTCRKRLASFSAHRSTHAKSLVTTSAPRRSLESKHAD